MRGGGREERGRKGREREEGRRGRGREERERKGGRRGGGGGGGNERGTRGRREGGGEEVGRKGGRDEREKREGMRIERGGNHIQDNGYSLSVCKIAHHCMFNASKLKRNIGNPKARAIGRITWVSGDSYTAHIYLNINC